MSAQVSTLDRQWVPLQGGSCSVRMGFDALEQAAVLFRDAVGRPNRCVVVQDDSLDDELRELIRRQVVSMGFSITWHVAPSGRSRTVDEAMRLYETFAQAGMTGDDLCCAIGDTDIISLASYVCAEWCGKVALVAIPVNEASLLEGALIPRALDVGAAHEMVGVRASVSHVLMDYDRSFSKQGSEASLYARALMVSAAMTSSERAFSTLWDRAQDIAGGDEDVFAEQLLDTAKTRGQTISSSAVAIRQSLEYGKAFVRVVDGLVQDALPASTVLAEGMRFAARIGVAQKKLSIDDMLAQDELLLALGLDTLACGIDPYDLAEGLKMDLLRRSNRAMLLVPFAIGRVRMATVSDEVLLEHAKAWCDAHAR